MPRWQRALRSRSSATRATISATCCGSSAGDTVLVFNGRDGEWRAAIAGRKRPDTLEILNPTRPQDRLRDLTYVFAPLKHARLDYMVQKAVEMGASRLQPVLTRFTQVARVNGERMRANVVEAAEQCGILTLAAVADPMPLEKFLGLREPQRLLVFCDEAAEVDRSAAGARPDRCGCDGIDVLIGPEGGFAEEERALLLRQPVLGCPWDRGSCAPTPPRWRRWRWFRRRLATGRRNLDRSGG